MKENVLAHHVLSRSSLIVALIIVLVNEKLDIKKDRKIFRIFHLRWQQSHVPGPVPVDHRRGPEDDRGCCEDQKEAGYKQVAPHRVPLRLGQVSLHP